MGEHFSIIASLSATNQCGNNAEWDYQPGLRLIGYEAMDNHKICHYMSEASSLMPTIPLDPGRH
jgi:hypothetical protein